MKAICCSLNFDRFIIHSSVRLQSLTGNFLTQNGPVSGGQVNILTFEKEERISRKRYTPEQIIGLLREAEVALAQGEKTGVICRSLGVSERGFYRWRCSEPRRKCGSSP
jgi:hypothetical protein